MKKLIPLLVAVTFALFVGLLGCDTPIPFIGSEAEQHYKWGIYHDTKSNIDIAIEEYTKAIELNPEYAEAYCRRSNDYWILAGRATSGQLKSAEYRERAISDINHAIELKPDYWEAYYSRGNVNNNIGVYDAAIADFSKVMELEHEKLPIPYDWGVYDGRGKAYLQKGEYACAIADFTRIIELHPKDASAYIKRGIAYMRKGEYNSAISDHNRAVELRVESYSGKYKYLWPQYADCYLYRGQTYRALGLKNEAIADFEKVIELTNNPAWVQAAKQGIEELQTQSK